MRWLRGRVLWMPTRRQQRQRAEVGPDGWTCHVCGDYRPDERISVHSTVVMIGGVEARQNVRYCNDRVACVEGAAHVHFVTSKED